MDIITLTTTPPSPIFSSSSSNNNKNKNYFSRQIHSNISFPYYSFSKLTLKRSCFTVGAKKKNPQPDPVLDSSSFMEQVYVVEDDDEDEEFLADDFDDDELVEDDENFQDEYFLEDEEPYVGDGGGGGGISLAGTSWDKEALAIADAVCQTFDGDLGIYAFKTISNNIIRVRIEKLSTKSGSPNMEDIEAFSKAYRAKLDEAEIAGTIPVNISLEVSSPGVERVIRIPQDLDRFKERNMYVKYVSAVAETGASCESDGVFRLISFDLERNCCTWGLADARLNREKAGKGRPLNKKQREWRLETPFDSLQLIKALLSPKGRHKPPSQPPVPLRMSPPTSNSITTQNPGCILTSSYL